MGRILRSRAMRLAFRVSGTRRRLALVWVGAASYLGLTALVAWQALRGQPLLAPDATTLMLAAAWLGATLLAAALAWRLPAPLNRP